MINKLKEIINSINFSESFKRIDERHPLQLYIGRDEKNRITLLNISNDEPCKLNSTKMIEVFIGKRQDNKWATSFSLFDNEYEDQFLNFCLDIYESTRSLNDSFRSGMFVATRYKKWMEMLNKKNLGLLSISEIKGLIGEIFFLHRVLSKENGLSKAIASWLGPFRADQDFIINDTWYEIKNTTLDSPTVKISSISQLDSTYTGHLVVFRMEKTSSTDLSKITLNSIIQDVLKDAEDNDKTVFLDILSNHGYVFREEYNDICFRFHRFDKYKIENDFPCVRRNQISMAVENVEYNLLLSSIENYKE